MFHNGSENKSHAHINNIRVKNDKLIDIAITICYRIAFLWFGSAHIDKDMQVERVPRGIINGHAIFILETAAVVSRT